MASPPKPRATEQPKRICLGKIVSAHGVKGLVKILPFGEDVSLLETLSPLYTGAEGTERLGVKIHNLSGKTLTASVTGCKDRDHAQNLRGTELWTNRENLPELNDETEFYIEDLISLEVRNIENVRIGKVTSVDNFGAGDLLDIHTDQGKSGYVPFRSVFVGDVNGKEGFLILTDEGLAFLE
ncbi:MAG: 16S rRNA processing protein RimM [Alphaproteobacteria bacterium]|nr:16S rRNA processing protein RimM [Alphaproteobacteria bacterium]MBP7759468.1 16S rRNA processing protein RimM [Alphaproteobacteria bacterium]MBP7762808.1 16S rRNA processing protein RimM [Alphaproteobacteria bacterium]MBP7904340.1 16S rRNA processing protein RimM [Alphaproteobacteria bacterium]